MDKKKHTALVSITISLTPDEKKLLTARAEAECRSVRQMGRILLIGALKSAPKGKQQHSTSVASR